MASAGAARARMNAADRTAASTGCVWTTPAHRCAAGISSFSSERSGVLATASSARRPAFPRPNTLPPRKATVLHWVLAGQDGSGRRHDGSHIP
jgi:hypothetical protein